MPPNTPQQGQDMESQQIDSSALPNVPAGLDPSAYVLTKAIAYQEGGGQILSPDAKGQSGETGIYQYQSATWNARASQVLGPNAPSIQDATPDEQNEVTYKWVENKLNTVNPNTGKNYTPAEVASMHNAGEGAPDAWQGNKGTNVEGVQYNTKQYVQNVQKYAQQLWNGKTPGTTSPTVPKNSLTNGYAAPIPPAPEPIQQPTTLGIPGTNDPSLSKSLGGNGVIGDVEDIAGNLLPVLPDLVNDVQGKSDKTALQQIGDAGMSALWFLPFGDIAEGLGAAGEALGIGSNAAKTAGVIGTGLASGYASDVSSNLGKGKTGSAAFTPGIGTAIGGGLSAAALGGGALYNKFLGQQNAVDKVQQIWEDAAGSTKSGITNMSKTAAKGLASNPEFLANAGILPETSEVNGRLVFNTGSDSQAQQVIDKRISALSELRDASLDKGLTNDLGGGMTIEHNPPMVNFEDLRQQMLDQASKEFSGTAMSTAKSQINAEMDALKADPKYEINTDGEMTAAQTSKIKTYLQGRASLDKLTQGLSSQVYDTMQGVAKKSVEDAAEASGNPDVRAINKIIQQHYDAQKFLDKINGQTIKGGRLGTYVKEGVGTAIGGAVGTAFGKGPIGTGVGMLAGYKGGELVSNLMQKLAAGGSVTAATFGRMATEEPEVVQRLLQYVGTDTSKAETVAPIFRATSRSSAADIATNVLKESPGSRVYRGMSRPNYIFGKP